MSTEDDIEMLKAKIAEQEKSIASSEQERIDNSTGHKFLILIIVLALGGVALYFTGYWPTVVSIAHRLSQQFMDVIGQVKLAVQDAVKMI